MRKPRRIRAHAATATTLRAAAANDESFFRAACPAGGDGRIGPWIVCEAGAAWQLRRRAADGGGWIDFYGGNAQPLRLTQVDAWALAAAINRRAVSLPSCRNLAAPMSPAARGCERERAGAGQGTVDASAG